jgi:hypothetical protein
MKNVSTWRKSTASGADANCVEIGRTPEAAAIRDSKNPDGPHLVVPLTAFRAFLRLD